MPERSKIETNRARHQDEDGNAIGLTEAFAPLEDEGAFPEETSRIDFGEGDFEEAEQAPVPKRRGRHARHVRVEDEGEGAPEAFGGGGEWEDEPASQVELGVIGAAAENAACAAGSEGRHARRGRRGHDGDEVPHYMKKSRRMRSILIAAIALLVILGLAGAFYTWQLIEAAQQAAEDKAAEVMPGEQEIESEASDDASTVTAKKVSAPNLVSLLGLDLDAALSHLGEGAQVSSTLDYNAQGGRLAEGEELAFTEVTISLAGAASDARMGHPSVFLEVSAQGAIERAGYSTTTTLLGFGSQSFEDVVTNGHVVEATLEEAGVSVAEGSVLLPADKADYSTYADDGTTLTREYCSFNGKADSGEGEVSWSAVLSYDYAMYNATGNLGDTVRVIYVYVE